MQLTVLGVCSCIVPASKLRAIQDIQDMLDSLLAMFRKLDGDQLEVPNPSSKKPKAESQVYSCRCERPMVLILHLDIKRDVLRTETTARRFYALGCVFPGCLSLLNYLSHL
jgi:hypothetical protein